MKTIAFTVLFAVSISISPVFATENKYPEDVCKGIFNAIGTFIVLADKEWKETRNEEKALFYITSSSKLCNYL